MSKAKAKGLDFVEPSAPSTARTPIERFAFGAASIVNKGRSGYGAIDWTAIMTMIMTLMSNCNKTPTVAELRNPGDRHSAILQWNVARTLDRVGRSRRRWRSDVDDCCEAMKAHAATLSDEEAEALLAQASDPSLGL